MTRCYEELVTTTDRRTAIEEGRTVISVLEKKAGGAEGIRTPDFLLAKEALSRTELQPHAVDGRFLTRSF